MLVLVEYLKYKRVRDESHLQRSNKFYCTFWIHHPTCWKKLRKSERYLGKTLTLCGNEKSDVHENLVGGNAADVGSQGEKLKDYRTRNYSPWSV